MSQQANVDVQRYDGNGTGLAPHPKLAHPHKTQMEKSVCSVCLSFQEGTSKGVSMARLLMTSHFAPATAQISANFQCQTLNACKELSHILLCANLCKMCARLDPHKIFCLQTRCSRITHPKKSRKIKVCPSTFTHNMECCAVSLNERKFSLQLFTQRNTVWLQSVCLSHKCK